MFCIRSQHAANVFFLTPTVFARAGAVGACVDPEERRILLEWQERTSYRQPAMSTFLSSVLSTLSFREMPGQVSRALFGHMSGHPLKGRGASLKKRVYKALFYIIFGVVDWVGVVIQIAFPIGFFCALFLVPVCY